MSQHTAPQQYSYYIGWYVVSSMSHHWQSNATQLISGQQPGEVRVAGGSGGTEVRPQLDSYAPR